MYLCHNAQPILPLQVNNLTAGTLYAMLCTQEKVMARLNINIGHSITVDGFQPNDDLDVCYRETIVAALTEDHSVRANRKGFSGMAFDYYMSSDKQERDQQYSIRDDTDEATFIRVALSLGFLDENCAYWITTRKFNKFGHRMIVAIHFDEPPHSTPWP